MKIRNDFVTNSSSSCFVTIHLDSPLIEKYLQNQSVVYDDVPYDNARDLFNEVSSVLSDDRLVGYRLPDNTTIVDILSFLITFEESQFLDDSVEDFIAFLKEHKSEIEQNSIGEICFISTSDGDAPTVEGIGINKGLSKRLWIELYGSDDLEKINDAIYDAAFPEDIDPLMLKDLFDKYGEIQ